MAGLGRALALAAAVALVAGQANAQRNMDNDYGGGTLLRPRQSNITQRGPGAAERVLQGYAQCVYQRQPTRIEALLQMPVGNRDYEKNLNQVVETLGDNCLTGAGGELHFDNGLFRGYLAEAGYRLHFGRHGPTAFAPDGDTGVAKLYGDTPSPAGRRHVLLQEFGECVVRRDGAAARTLALSEPMAAREAAALETLKPALSVCLQKGTQVNFSRPALRATLVEALYRVSLAEPGTAK